MPRRRPELPRLFEALGLDEDGLRQEMAALERSPQVDRGLDFWVPDRADLSPGTTRGPRGEDVPQDLGAPAAPGGEGGPVDPRRPSPRRRHVAGRPAPERRPRVVAVPAGLRGARWRVRPRVAVALLVVIAVATAVLAVRVAWARSDAAPRIIAPTTSATAGDPVVVRTAATFGGTPAASGAAPGGPVSTAASGPSPPPTGGLVVVHVVGQVRHPGVVRLPTGSRVADAVRSAGGPTSGADLSLLNLARLLLDGEQVRVPRPGEDVPVVGPSGGAPGGAATGGAGGGEAGGGGVGGAAGGPVNLNTADLAALDSLPGVGPVLAQRILDWRTENGRFTSVDELGEVSGIGEKVLATLRPKVVV